MTSTAPGPTPPWSGWTAPCPCTSAWPCTPWRTAPLVTCVRDGMNLVPYEYTVCRQGVQVGWIRCLFPCLCAFLGVLWVGLQEPGAPRGHRLPARHPGGLPVAGCFFFFSSPHIAFKAECDWATCGQDCRARGAMKRPGMACVAAICIKHGGGLLAAPSSKHCKCTAVTLGATGEGTGCAPVPSGDLQHPARVFAAHDRNGFQGWLRL